MRVRIAILAGVLALALGGVGWWLLRDDPAPAMTVADIENPPPDKPELEPEPAPEPYYPEDMSPPKELKPSPDELEKWERIRRYNEYVRKLQRGEIEEEEQRKARALPPKVEMADAVERVRPAVPEGVPRELQWMRLQQHDKGFWRDATVAEEDEAVGNVFVTAVAMLSGSRRGYSHKRGDLRAAVNRAVLWSRMKQHNSGSFVEGDVERPVMQHAAATLAICEIHWLSGDRVLKPIADKAVDYLVNARGGQGAWGWKAQDAEPNVIATGWALLALRTAANAGLSVPQETFDRAAEWVWSLRRVGYVAWSAGTDDMEAETADSRGIADAVFVLALKWGKHDVLADASAAASLERLQLKRRIWDGETNDLMEWFFAATAVHELAETTAEFDDYTRRQIESGARVGTQVEGDLHIQTRYWESHDHWSTEFGPVYTTAMAVLTENTCTPPHQD